MVVAWDGVSVRSSVHPAGSFERIAEETGVQDFGQDAGRFDQTRARAVEELVAVRQIDAAFADGPQLVPSRIADQRRQLLPRAGDVEAAGHEGDHVGIARDQLIPVEPGRMFARRAEQVASAGDFHHLGDPVAGRHQRVDPFDAGDRGTRTGGRYLRADRVEFLPQPVHQRLRPIGGVQGAAHGADVGPDVGQPHWRQRDDLRRAFDADHLGHRPLDVFEADRADLALRLRDDVRRVEAFEHVGKDAIDRDGLAGQRFHPLVDLAARGVDVDLGLGASGQGQHLGRKIALVRAADQVVTESERRDDFRRASDQRDNSRLGHREISSAADSKTALTPARASHGDAATARRRRGWPSQSSRRRASRERRGCPRHSTGRGPATTSGTCYTTTSNRSW